MELDAIEKELFELNNKLAKMQEQFKEKTNFEQNVLDLIRELIAIGRKQTELLEKIRSDTQDIDLNTQE